MANFSFHLFQLQKIDSQIDQINTRLKKISDLLVNDPQLIEAENELSSCQTIYSEKENSFSDLENQAAKKKIKIEQSESALYSGKNSNPKELKDLQAEIESLKHSLLTLEEDQLGVMSSLDEIDTALQTKKERFSLVKAESDKRNSNLLCEKSNLEKELYKFTAERLAASGQIPADILQNYEKLRIIKNHIAVTSVEDQSCSTCGSEITAAEIQKSRTSITLCYCPSCGRILYAG
jgi:predicted  nucleic acid-binding Zn-ribbon protein